ncbi:MAG: dihydrofolate reductase family protein [Myxococcaceae bacterium]
MKRPHTSAFVGVSLDGFLARPDGSIDWLEPFEGQEHGFADFFQSIDTLVIGRKTYEFVLRHLAGGGPWLYRGKRCVVVTHRAMQAQNGERAFAGEPTELLAQLQAEGARHIYVDGGVVIRSFLAAGLLDDLTMTVVPSLIGEGLPLFGGLKLESGLLLDGVKSFGDQLVQLRYRLRQP